MNDFTFDTYENPSRFPGFFAWVRETLTTLTIEDQLEIVGAVVRMEYRSGCYLTESELHDWVMREVQFSGGFLA